MESKHSQQQTAIFLSILIKVRIRLLIFIIVFKRKRNYFIKIETENETNLNLFMSIKKVLREILQEQTSKMNDQCQKKFKTTLFVKINSFFFTQN